MTRPIDNFIAAGSRWLAAPGVLCRFVARSLTQVLCARAAMLLLIAVALDEATILANAQDEVALDYQVKAAFLVNFPKYVDWPSDAFSGTNASITVAVFGDDNVANEFQNMIQSGLAIDGHPVVLKRIKSEADITGGGFQILFIATSERARVSAVLEKLKGSPVLLVGESDNFLEQGGMINMVPKNRKIRLQINLGAARQASLKISSRLLVAADVVKGKEN
jgi:hypothetical protein